MEKDLKGESEIVWYREVVSETRVWLLWMKAGPVIPRTAPATQNGLNGQNVLPNVEEEASPRSENVSRPHLGRRIFSVLAPATPLTLAMKHPVPNGPHGQTGPHARPHVVEERGRGPESAPTPSSEMEEPSAMDHRWRMKLVTPIFAHNGQTGHPGEIALRIAVEEPEHLTDSVLQTTILTLPVTEEEVLDRTEKVEAEATVDRALAVLEKLNGLKNVTAMWSARLIRSGPLGQNGPSVPRPAAEDR